MVDEAHHLLDFQAYHLSSERPDFRFGCTCGEHFYDADPEVARLRFIYHATGLDLAASDRLINLAREIGDRPTALKPRRSFADGREEDDVVAVDGSHWIVADAEELTRRERELDFATGRAAILASAVGRARLHIAKGETRRAGEVLDEAAEKTSRLLNDALTAHPPTQEACTHPQAATWKVGPPPPLATVHPCPDCGHYFIHCLGPNGYQWAPATPEAQQDAHNHYLQQQEDRIRHAGRSGLGSKVAGVEEGETGSPALNESMPAPVSLSYRSDPRD